MTKNNKTQAKTIWCAYPEAPEYCPNCGMRVENVRYYTANVVGSSSRRSGHTITTTTTYGNIEMHTGGLCRPCGHLKYSKRRAMGNGIAIAGVVLGVAAMIITKIFEADGYESQTVVYLLYGLLIAMIGFCISASGSFRPKTYVSDSYSFNKFNGEIHKEIEKSGLVVLSPGYVNQLKKR